MIRRPAARHRPSGRPSPRLSARLPLWLAGLALGVGLLIAGPTGVGLGTGAALAQCAYVQGAGVGCLRERIQLRRAERRARARAARQRRNAAAASGRAAAARSGGSTNLNRIDPAIQEALNDTGFLVGAADGLVGRQTRRGISDFQRTLNAPATGTLTEDQRATLMRAQAMVREENIVVTPAQREALIARVVAGASATTAAATAPAPAPAQDTGDAMAGDAMAAATIPEPPAATVPRDEANVIYVDPQDNPDRDAAPAPAPPTETAGLCANAASDADVTKVAVMEPDAAILAGFCRPRRYLVDIVDPATLGTDDGRGDLETCADWGARTGLDARNIAALDPPDVAEAFAERVPQGDTERRSTLAIAKTCIGLAYRHGDMETGRFYALFAVALGAGGFGELAAAHHGLGNDPDDDLEAAAAWYDWTAQALGNGAATITDEDGQSRVRLMRILAAKTDSLIDAPAASADPQAGSAEDRMAPGGTAPGEAAANEASTDEASQEELPPRLAARAREAAAVLPLLLDALELDEAELTDLCDESADILALRLCRVEAYAAQDPERMRTFDEALADLDDPVGRAALAAWTGAPRTVPLAASE